MLKVPAVDLPAMQGKHVKDASAAEYWPPAQSEHACDAAAALNAPAGQAVQPSAAASLNSPAEHDKHDTCEALLWYLKSVRVRG